MAPKIITEHPNAIRVGVIGTVVLAGLLFVMTHTARQQPEHQAPTMTMVMIEPPKPPPPPPPLPQPKIVQPQKIVMPNVKPLVPNQPPKPKPAPPRPAAPAVTPMGTSIHNNGPADAFNLNGNPGGNGFLGGGGGGGGGGGSYAEAVSYTISQALQHNKTTRNASAGLRVQLWVDGAGNVTRVALVTSSGNQDVDDAIRDQVLAHLQLGAPPAGTPMPILLSLTGQSTL